MQGRVIAVFGCGGDRDKGKRPRMGRVASQMADVVIITSDNPRSENPEKIIEDILEGVGGDAECIVLPDREEAIRRAIEEARTGDIVMILGKGHETYQILGNIVVPFDDREVARKYLVKRFEAQANSAS